MSPLLEVDELPRHHNKDAEGLSKVRPSPPAAGDHKWKKPDPGFIKIKCDASISSENGCGIGFVGRNDAGMFCFAV